MEVGRKQTADVARLFEFLREVQRLRVKTVLTISAYVQDGGSAIDLDNLPSGFGVDPTGLESIDGSTPPLVVPRLATVAAPVPPEALKPWLEGTWSKHTEPPPRLAQVLTFPDGHDSEDGSLRYREESLGEHPDITETYEGWLREWNTWAQQEQSTKPTRDLYQKLYTARETITAASQDWELILAVGRLRWDESDRHVLVQPVHIELDETSGALKVLRDDAFILEQDMLNTEQLPSADAAAALADDLGMGYEVDLITARLSSYTHQLNPDATFGSAPSSTGTPWIMLSPSIILRRRSRLGMVQVLDQIAEFLNDTDEVPEGLLPLVDPDFIARGSANMQPSEEGAVHWHEDEYFLPLPVNREQFEVIKRVDHQPLTLVQGPPGTGKTHTTAALISHLLAQGKRVLVTAQTEQALHEVREKLPVEVQDLAVAVLGTGQAEKALLTRSVSVLAERANQYSEEEANYKLKQLRAELDESHKRRAKSRNRLVEMREADVANNRVGHYSGTRAQIAQQVNDDRDRYGWVFDLLGDEIAETSPVTGQEWSELLDLLRDTAIAARDESLSYRLPKITDLLGAADFSRSVEALGGVEAEISRYSTVAQKSDLQPLRTVDLSEMGDLEEELRELRAAMVGWDGKTEPWIKDCISDILNERTLTWTARQTQISKTLRTAEDLVQTMGDEHAIVVDDSLPGFGRIMAQASLDHIASGSKIKTDTLGNPKLGIFAPQVVRASAQLFVMTRVDGRPPVSGSALNRLIARIDASQALDALDVAWPSTVVPLEDTISERLAWHASELDVLDKLLIFAERIDQTSNQLGTVGVSEFDWTTTQDLDDLLSFTHLLKLEHQRENLIEPMRDLEAKIISADSVTQPSPTARTLASAVRSCDTTAYAACLDDISILTALSSRRNQRDELLARASSVAPKLTSALERTVAEESWSANLQSIELAWAWRYSLAWISRTRPENINQMQMAIRAEEDKVHEIVAKIAAERAWAKSVGRLKRSQISDLVQYTQLVRKLGKGTGKYAAKWKHDIRKTLERCTDAVPVWIVPLHRVSTQFKIQPELFDVVIIDEASQAGLDATFLQFLGRKIVVVGDDKQVSPTVIINHANVHKLADHYLHDSPYAATWSDPERSLFDEARVKYPDLITLVEHRRCVPDIIGFSNEIAYEPDGIRLMPVRETGSSALEPVVSVFVEDGYAEGSGSGRRNPPEARAIVDTIKEAISDPRYDGLTMGVISLLGDLQARLIETMLLDEVGPLEISKRDIRCGVAPAFQGAERDVIFLSMVSATDDENRFAAQTKETQIQRYNVAVSRAKDQLWIFYSEPLANLTNPDDLRRRLLEYAQRVTDRRGSGVPGATQELAPEDVLVAPFDSLFEQRVHNRIFERGYVVVPQYPSLGYKIDLVVVGANGKFAIECDGDYWHGPDNYLADLARERELERCGWRFFRIIESDFVVDKFGSLEPLWPLLDTLSVSNKIQEISTVTSRVIETDLNPLSIWAKSQTREDENLSHGTDIKEMDLGPVNNPESVHALEESIPSLPIHHPEGPGTVLGSISQKSESQLPISDVEPESGYLSGSFSSNSYTLRLDGTIKHRESGETLARVNPKHGEQIGKKLKKLMPKGGRLRLTTTGTVARHVDGTWVSVTHVSREEWFPGHL